MRVYPRLSPSVSTQLVGTHFPQQSPCIWVYTEPWNEWKNTVVYYLLLFVCKRPDWMTSHQRAVLIANRWFTMSNMKRRVFVLHFGARAFFTAFLPLASHRMNHAAANTHLQVQCRAYGKSNSTGGRIEFRVWTLTLSGWQRTSVQPQSLVMEEVANPAGQLRVEFLQLHVHSSSSQHFVFFTVSWRCDGHPRGAWRAHSSFLHTEAVKQKACENISCEFCLLCLEVFNREKSNVGENISLPHW